MDLLQAVFTSESSLKINGRLIVVKNGFSILITCLHHTIVSFSFFIDLFQRAKIHFSPPNSPFQPAKCATMPDKEIIINK